MEVLGNPRKSLEGFPERLVGFDKASKRKPETGNQRLEAANAPRSRPRPVRSVASEGADTGPGSSRYSNPGIIRIS